MALRYAARKMTTNRYLSVWSRDPRFLSNITDNLSFSFFGKHGICRYCYSTKVNGSPTSSSSRVPPTQINESKNPYQSEQQRQGHQQYDYGDNPNRLLQGEILDLAADLRTFRPGDRLDIPYELTVSESMQDFWQSVSSSFRFVAMVVSEGLLLCYHTSYNQICEHVMLFALYESLNSFSWYPKLSPLKAFHAQDRINTSRPFARKIGLQDRVLPFSLALFLTSSMTHEDAAKVQVGFGKVSYLWPAFAGDTFTKTFTVESIRNTSDGHNSVSFSSCRILVCRYNFRNTLTSFFLAWNMNAESTFRSSISIVN